MDVVAVTVAIPALAAVEPGLIQAEALVGGVRPVVFGVGGVVRRRVAILVEIVEEVLALGHGVLQGGGADRALGVEAAENLRAVAGGKPRAPAGRGPWRER